jgi:hypothetical protein
MLEGSGESHCAFLLMQRGDRGRGCGGIGEVAMVSCELGCLKGSTSGKSGSSSQKVRGVILFLQILSCLAVDEPLAAL